MLFSVLAKAGYAYEGFMKLAEEQVAPWMTL